jgi:chromosomal replication initiator protein
MVDVQGVRARCFTFENFIIDESNEQAYAAARRIVASVPLTISGQSSNSLVIKGGVGLGKTHLMVAIAQEFCAPIPERNVYYMSAEQFGFLLIRALRLNVSVERMLPSVDIILIDDLDLLAMRISMVTDLLHALAVLQKGRRTLVLSWKPSAELKRIERRLLSSLRSGLATTIGPITYELRLRILQGKAAKSESRIGRDVLELIARKYASSVCELEGAFNRAVAEQQLCRRSGTLVSDNPNRESGGSAGSMDARPSRA